jgi:4'-phosphopantetheinyl transferase
VWEIAPENISLNENDIHIWRSSLDLAPEKVANLTAILSEDEQIRADRFRFLKHKTRFVVARAMLRIILGKYLGIAPGEVLFQYSSRGKPTLVNNADNQIQFNLSHSEELVIYGFTQQKLIGVDLEYLRPIPDLEKLAQRFFSAREYDFIKSLRQGEKKQAFFQIWTAKEAYLKATGEGLANSLDKVEIDITQVPKVGLLSINGSSQITEQWKLYSFTPQDNYLASLAVETNHWNLSYYN